MEFRGNSWPNFRLEIQARNGYIGVPRLRPPQCGPPTSSGSPGVLEISLAEERAIQFKAELKPIFPYVRRHLRAYLIGFVATIFATAAQLASPWILKFAVESFRRPEGQAHLFGYAVGLVVLAAVAGIFRYLMRQQMIGASRKIEYELRNDYFAHLQRLSPSFYRRVKTGDLMARATNDLNAVRMMLGPGIMHSSSTILIATAAVAQMVSIDPVLAAISLLPLPAMSAVVFGLMKRIRTVFEAVQAQYSRISEKVQENLAGIRIVKSYVSEQREIELFEKHNRAFIEENLRLAKIRGSLVGTIEALAGIGMLLILWLGGRRVISGAISLGDLVAFMSFLTMLAWPMIALGWTMNLIQQGRASLTRIDRIMREKPEIADGPHTDYSIQHLSGGIRFEGVNFGYEPGQLVLRDIELDIPAGHTVAVVGRTGAGKTSLLNLVPRLHDPTSGRVLIDGHDAREIPLSVLRRHIGMVPQDTFLFSDTIRENIAFGVENPDPDRIAWAVKVAHLEEDLAGFPDGLDTMLGERGINLSGGQKQRVALARAVLREPAILLLDDALSAVDTQTEERILANLRQVMQQRTTIIVSHRISAVKDADLIVVLRDGEIAELGTHDELLALGGLYWELYEMQKLEEALEAF